MGHTNLTVAPPFIKMFENLGPVLLCQNDQPLPSALGRPLQNGKHAAVHASGHAWWGICCACKAHGVGDTFLIERALAEGSIILTTKC